MKFIFPQNYNFKSKLFGFIDYSTAILNILWAFIIFIFLRIFNLNIKIKIFIFISFSLPILIFSIVGFNGENILYVFKYIIKYFLKPKIYLFTKHINYKK